VDPDPPARLLCSANAQRVIGHALALKRQTIFAVDKLTYNDSLKENISFNPYVEYWRELNNKATVLFNPSTSGEGGYLTVGSTPTFNVGPATPGYEAQVHVFAQVDDQQLSWATAFTPR